MSALGTIAWLFGVWLKYNLIYGVVVSGLIVTALAFLQNNSMKKDNKCKGHLWTNVPIIIFAIGGLITSVSQFFLKDWAQSLIDQNA